jgi:hypothetical protein
VTEERKAGSGSEVWREELQVAGDQLVATVKKLLHEGNVNRVIVKNQEGQTLIEVPLTLGVVGFLVAPVWAALGALAALAAQFTIEVERTSEDQ